MGVKEKGGGGGGLCSHIVLVLSYKHKKLKEVEDLLIHKCNLACKRSIMQERNLGL